MPSTAALSTILKMKIRLWTCILLAGVEKGTDVELVDGSRVAVIGGGPAGSLFSHFLLDMAKRVDVRLEVDLYEPRDYGKAGPQGCNMCGGVVSESLVQMLAIEGINLPGEVVQRSIDSYVLHTPGSRVAIRTPVDEMRIAALYRGAGPKGCASGEFRSLDGFRLDLARTSGASHMQAKVDDLGKDDDGFPLVTAGGQMQRYDLVVGAVGVNSPALKLMEKLGLPYQPPRIAKAFLSEWKLGREEIARHMGHAMHVFLGDDKRIEFAALIPKGDYVTICVLGDDIDQTVIDTFMNTPEVKSVMPIDWDIRKVSCRCMPKINVGQAQGYFCDRVALIGDAGTTRLYKDGIGAAYRTAKACAMTVLYHGVRTGDFQRFYAPTCDGLEFDNRIGHWVFRSVGLMRVLPFLRRGMVGMTAAEQRPGISDKAMSMVLWDTFTGSNSYRSILGRSLTPRFLARLGLATVKGLFKRGAA